jgi:hypothetical protein
VYSAVVIVYGLRIAENFLEVFILINYVLDSIALQLSCKEIGPASGFALHLALVKCGRLLRGGDNGDRETVIENVVQILKHLHVEPVDA